MVGLIFLLLAFELELIRREAKQWRVNRGITVLYFDYVEFSENASKLVLLFLLWQWLIPDGRPA